MVASAPACRLCRSATADSLEHIFQSAIGGRRAVAGILCKPCNDRLGAGIDADLAKALEWVRMLLAVEGDRGQMASVRTADAQGRAIILRPGALPESAPAPPRVDHVDASTLNMTSFTHEQALQLTAAHQRKRPDQVLQVRDVKVQKTFPGPTTFNVSLDVETFARTSLKTMLVLLGRLGHESEEALAQAWRYVGGADVGSDVRAHWSSLPAPWSDDSLGTTPHMITVRSDPATESVTADVRYFGDLAICLQMRARLARSFELGYGVDPFTGLDLHYGGRIGWIDVPGAADGQTVVDAIDRALRRIARAAEARGLAALRESVVQECTRKVIGNRVEPDTDAERAAILACVSDEMAFILRREDCEDDAPELVVDLQAAADRVRSGGR
jgi:hypothetical protein